MSDIDQLRGFAEALRDTPVQALDAAAKALNQAAELARDRGIEEIGQRYNLKQHYIADNLTVRSRAARTDLLARIGGKQRDVLATQYGAEQATTAAPRAKGDPYRGIPSGQKGAGSRPWSVLRGGSSKAWRNAFFVRLKDSGAWALVARYGSGAGMDDQADWKANLDVVKGVSVAGAWRSLRDDVAPEAMALASEIFLLELNKGAR